MQSTAINRTLMSGYSELMGIYPPSSSNAKLTQGELKSLETGRGMPQMKVSSATRINTDLGNDALPNGFVSLPISTFYDPSVLDDVSYNGCPYVGNSVDYLSVTNSNYINWWWIANFAREPLADSLGIDYQPMDDVPFLEVYH
jgi:hypothetical protein